MITIIRINYKSIVFISFLALFYSCTYNTPRLPERGIGAHRGASGTHPENTISAFEEAIRLGAHMIEFDVRMSKDGVLVIMHDSTVDRTTNGSGKVLDLTYSYLKTLDAGSWKSIKFKGEKIPTLSETLDIMPRNIWLNIHIKGNTETAKQTAELIIAKERKHQAIIACKTEAIEAIRQIDSSLLICNMERLDNPNNYVIGTIQLKANFIQLKERADLFLTDLIKKLKQKNIKINYYKTNTAEKLKSLFEQGVDFPLVDKLREMMDAAAGIGISPLIPEY